MWSNSRAAMRALVAASNSGVISAVALLAVTESCGWAAIPSSRRFPSVISLSRTRWRPIIRAVMVSGDGLAGVGGLDLGAAPDVVGRPLEDGAAEVDDVDPLAEREHEVHVVLHQQQGDVVL